MKRYCILNTYASHTTSKFRKKFVYCNKNPIYVFPEKELCGLSPNFHIHVSVSGLCITTMGLPILLQENMLTFNTFISF
jgi:hypothetical protein